MRTYKTANREPKIVDPGEVKPAAKVYQDHFIACFVNPCAVCDKLCKAALTERDYLQAPK